jgi:hypothetical protein
MTGLTKQRVFQSGARLRARPSTPSVPTISRLVPADPRRYRLVAALTLHAGAAVAVVVAAPVAVMF